MSKTAKNTVVMLFGSIGQKIVSLVYFTFLARTLGKGLTGEYTAALAFSTLFVVFVDLGLTNVLIRNGAQQKNNADTLFSSVLAIKVMTGIASYLALLITCVALRFGSDFLLLVAISGVTMLVDSFHLSLYGYLRAKSQLQYEAIGMVGSQMITLVIGTICLLLRLPLYTLMVSFLIASAANALFAFYHSQKAGLRLMLSWDGPTLRRLLRMAAPFALAVIFGRFYSYIDVVLLKKIAGNAAVGIYSTPSKISFAFQFIPLAFMAALYPRLSELFTTDLQEFRRTLTQSVVYLLLVALPISVGIFLLAKPIILLAFSEEYSESIVPLKIMILSLIFSFISFPLGAALNASHHEKWQTGITGFALLANVIANVFLIPVYGALGAASSALVGNFLLGSVGFFLLPKMARLLPDVLWKKIMRLLLAVTGMALAIVLVQGFLPLVLTLFAAVFVYVFLVYVFEIVTLDEIKQLRQSFKKI